MAQTYSRAKVVALVEWLNREKRFVDNKPKTDQEQKWAEGYVAGIDAALERIGKEFGVTG